MHVIIGLCLSMKEVRIIAKTAKPPKDSDRVQKSYYCSLLLDKALKFMAADLGKYENEIVVDALNSFIPKKYFDMAQK